MLGTVLGITIPLFYLFSACGIAHYVAISINMDRAYDDFERKMAAVIIGLFWPVALPFYVALHGT